MILRGTNSIWISPIYDSPMKDFGYDISNFTSIWPVLLPPAACVAACVRQFHSAARASAHQLARP